MKNAIVKKIAFTAAVLVLCCMAIAMFTACEDKEETEKVFVESEVFYELDTAKVWGREITPLLDEKKTYIKLTPDGDLELRIMLNETGITLANVFIAGLGITSGENAAVDVSGLEKYVNGLFPTESFKDMIKIIRRLETDLGLYVEGIDYESEAVKKLINGIDTEQKIYLNGILLPKNLAFVIKGKYELKEITSKTQNEPIRAVYLGEYNELGEPYVVMTQFKDSEEKECLRVRNELLALDVVTKIKPPVLSEAE